MGAGRPFPSWTAARGFVVSCLLPLNFPLISLFLCLSLSPPLSLSPFLWGAGRGDSIAPSCAEGEYCPWERELQQGLWLQRISDEETVGTFKGIPPPPPRPPLGFHSPSSQQRILTLGRIPAPLTSHQVLYSTHLQSCSSYPFHTRIPAQTWDYEYRTIPDLTRVDS